MIPPSLIHKLHKPAPRYTSYPTAPSWDKVGPEAYATCLKKAAATEAPLSLYFHIPFCKTMCLYCACSVILNRKVENEERYVAYLEKEIALVSGLIGKKRVPQLHFGGGTPTKLSMPLFTRLFETIQTHFELDFSQEIAIEIDPRTVMEDEGEKLKMLRELGFNRASFGVQDTSEKVQKAVKRNQSYDMTKQTYELARKLGFEGINIDLIYGLPYQTVTSFTHTIAQIIALNPDRIALFSYAKVPWLKPHQKALRDETLPSTNEKFLIYQTARSSLQQAGYVAIGMDHFAKEDDELTKSYQNKTLHRNFQGYTVRRAQDMLGLGVTSIGYVQEGYFQNLKSLTDYYAALDQDLLPTHRGLLLSEEDLLRKWVIETLMCTFELDKAAFANKYAADFDSHFAAAQEALAELEGEGLVTNTPNKLQVTFQGELFVRNIAMLFDAYLPKGSHDSLKFSKSI